MIISIKIGYNSAVMFKDKEAALKFIDTLFNAAFYVENPEDMPIEVSFEMEDKNEGTELRSDSSSETV